MAKTKLLVSTKDSLKDFARRSIDVPSARKDVEEAYAKAVKLLRPQIEKEYPLHEMAILGRYGAAENKTNIQCVGENSRVVYFKLREQDAVLLPSPRYCKIHPRLLVSSACLNAVDKWRLKVDALDDARNKAFAKYRALIDAAKYVEDIIDVWPAAKPLLDEFIASRSQNLPVAVSPETLSFIRKDNAGAEKEADNG